jgi:hypothetical protein
MVVLDFQGLLRYWHTKEQVYKEHVDNEELLQREKVHWLVFEFLALVKKKR